MKGARPGDSADHYPNTGHGYSLRSGVMSNGYEGGLEEATKEAIRDAYQRLREGAAFVGRSGQRRMIAEVARTLSGAALLDVPDGCAGGRRILAVEGPTGTGKSVAYLLGAIPVARNGGKRLVVTTATISLQQQLVDRDLPDLAERSGLDFTWHLVKGRRRYVCQRNLADLTGSHGGRQESLELEIPAGGLWPFKPSKADRKAVASMEEALADGSWWGDLDRWSGALSPGVRDAVTESSRGCLGRACPFFRECAFFIARRRVDEADVVVANHDLVLSDLNMGGGVVLPDPAETFYIVDEAHHLPDLALEQAAAESPVQGARRWLEEIPRAAGRASNLLAGVGAGVEWLGDVERSAKELVDGLRAIESALELTLPQRPTARTGEGDPVWRLKPNEVAEGLREQAEALAEAGMRLTGGLARLREALRQKVQEGRLTADAAGRPIRETGFTEGQAERLARTWSLMGRVDQPDQPPVARWITRRSGDGDLLVSAAPTSASGFLETALWSKASGVVLTSATLTALGRFDRFSRRTGLAEGDGTRFLTLPSPFDYARQASLVVPVAPDLDPRDVQNHTAAVVRELRRRVAPEEGTLVLFASRRQMESVAAALAGGGLPELLVQGERARHEIVEIHCKRIEGGEGSIIFGLASFAEGIDLPGTLCRHVVIAKLPFTVPDSPLEAAYAEWLAARGRNPFMEVAVPDAGVRLLQACGRLIRSEGDSGRVTVLDQRLVTKPYGKQLMAGLPPFRVVVERQTGTG